MEFFDRVNLSGRLLIGLYFIFQGYIGLFYLPDNMTGWLQTIVSILSFIELLGGIALIIGFKPRATAAIIALILLVLTIIEFIFSSSEMAKFALNNPYVTVMMGKLAVFGACLFIAGTRVIPYGVMIRSAESMKQKYER